MKTSDGTFLTSGSAGTQQHNVIDLMEKFMARFHQSPISAITNADSVNLQHSEHNPEKKSKYAKDKHDEDQDEGSQREKRVQKIPDLIKFLADIEIPVSEVNEKLLFSLYLYALVL